MASTTNLSGNTILLMEDEMFVAMEIEETLIGAGATISGPHARVSAGLLALGETQIDGAILDVSLADGDVFPVAEQLQEKDIPFLFHTAHAARADLKERFGDVIVCRKPTAAKELSECLAEQIR